MDETELDPSVLGTREYWKEAYAKEIRNFDEFGDTGDVWFGEDSALRVIRWICDCGVDRNSPIIDLGTDLEIRRTVFIYELKSCYNYDSAIQSFMKIIFSYYVHT